MEKIENLIVRIDKKLEEKKVTDRLSRQLPQAKLVTWDGSVESYLDFRRQMDNMLQYDCEYLNLSTLKDQIKGKERSYILDLLHNVDDKAEALAVLDLHFDDIHTVLPRLKMKLDKLVDFPDSEEGQVKNMQSLINYYKISKQHDLQETAINFDFIQK